MAKKEITPYQQQKLEPKRREIWCGKIHDTIEEAIVCAEQDLRMYRQPSEPYWGTMRFTETWVVGWQVAEGKRYRLDHTPFFAKENAEAAAWSGTPLLKGSQGVHVNQENDVDPQPGRSRVVHPTHASLQWAETYWRKWTKRYR